MSKCCANCAYLHTQPPSDKPRQYYNNCGYHDMRIGYPSLYTCKHWESAIWSTLANIFKRKKEVDCNECRWFDHDKIECLKMVASSNTSDIDHECCGEVG
jgi:hypothetical protein